MTVLYIIGGCLFLILAVYFLDKQDKMYVESKKFKGYRKDIEDMNQQLDDIQMELDRIHEPLVKVNQVSTKILKYMKK